MKPESVICRLHPSASLPQSLRRNERGVILFVTMIALLILMVTGIALVRSFDSSLLLSGNVAFKRDMVNQGERAMAAAIAALNPGGALSTDTAREANLYSSNYSASMLASDNHGIPNMLTGNGGATWTMTGADIYDSTTLVTIRYVIDRMCTATGVETAATCSSLSPKVSGGDSREQRAIPATPQIVYRISVRISFPNNTQTFLQSTGYL